MNDFLLINIRIFTWPLFDPGIVTSSFLPATGNYFLPSCCLPKVAYIQRHFRQKHPPQWPQIKVQNDLCITSTHLILQLAPTSYWTFTLARDSFKPWSTRQKKLKTFKLSMISFNPGKSCEEVRTFKLACDPV